MSKGMRLGDIAELQVGYPFRSADFTRGPSGWRLLRGDNIAQGMTRWSGAAYWPGDEVEEAYHLACGDVVLAMDRPWIGAGLKYATISKADLPALLVQRVARLRARLGTDQSFLRYVVGTQAFADYIVSVQTGTAVPHISSRQILAFPVVVPALVEQRAIAEVLGALDDKIAVNERTADLAVELADTIFCSMAGNTEVGGQTFEDVATIGGGGTPSTRVAEYWSGGGIAWATPTDVTALRGPYLSTTARMITQQGLEACSSPLYPIGSILMTSRATIGAFAVAQRPLAVNQGFIVVNARNPRAQWWLFHEMRRRVAEFLSHANGATFLELPRGRFKKLPVRLPDEAAVAWFSEYTAALHNLASTKLAECLTLTSTRDELLPLLMSGRLRVKDAEKVVEEVV